MSRYDVDNPPKLLKFDDVVVFADCEYEVRNGHLHTEGGSNCVIFDQLDLSNDFGNQLVEKAYGYQGYSALGPSNPWWPEFRDGDFAAATRLVNILLILDTQNVAAKKEPWRAALNKLTREFCNKGNVNTTKLFETLFRRKGATHG